MASGLDSLISNLVGKKKKCKKYDRKETFELIHMSDDYVTHGKCRCCSEYFSKQLIINDFGNLKDNHADKQFRLLRIKEV